jgi:WD40 repeat protein
MRAILPGKPRAVRQAVTTAHWNEKRFIVYISGNAVVVLDGPSNLFQTIYQDDVESLDAVVIDEKTGKIAVASGTSVHIYKPYGQDEGVLKWQLQTSLESENSKDSILALSWGLEEELLIGSSSLKLYQTSEDTKLVWSRQLPSPATLATFSDDAQFIASAGNYDRLAKVWRRISYGSNDVLFDFSYLPHPAAVTALEWRKSHEEEHGNNNSNNSHVLYSVCADKKLRIWAAMNPHGTQVLQVWAEIHLEQSIHPRFLNPDTSHARYVLCLDSVDFDMMVKNAMQTITPQNQPVLEHLLEISERKPDVCLVLDDHGNMCAWGFERIGGKNRVAKDVFNVGYVENFNIFDHKKGEVAVASMSHFQSSDSSPNQTILVHDRNGVVTWLEGSIDQLFDPSLREQRLQHHALWTGHEGPIKKITRTMSGRAVMSRTGGNDGVIWKQNRRDMGSLTRQSILETDRHIHRTCFLDNGKFVINLHHKSISLWDVTGFHAVEITNLEYEIEGKPLCILQLPLPEEGADTVHVATISSHMKAVVWKVQIPSSVKYDIKANGALKPSLRQYCVCDLGSQKDLAFIVPIDPAGSKPVISGELSSFAKDVALCYTHSGVLSTWTAKIDLETSSANWLATSTVRTEISNPTLASGSSIRKVALVDETRSGLTIWDTRSQQLEFEHTVSEGETIQDLDWTSTPDQQSILAVGFPHKVVILAQVRYNYLDHTPAWTAIREIYLRELTPHPIGDSTWLGNGSLVIGAGNQLFVYDKLITASDDMISEVPVLAHKHNSIVDLFDVVSLLNGPLPVYHPQFISQCLLAGKMMIVQRVIARLQKALKFFSDGDDLDSSLGIQLEEFAEDTEVSANYMYRL